ncbi:hypothetical protein JG688_00002669, partial [Phytophthora aleatoria]
MKDTIKKQLEDFVDCKINKAAAATGANGVSWSEFVKRQATILRIKGLCQLAEQFGVVRKRESRGLRPIDVLASADSAESTSSSDDDMGQQEDEDSSTARTQLKSRVRDNEVQWETWLEGALEKALKKPMDQVLRLLNEKARVEKNDMLEALEQTAKVIVEKAKVKAPARSKKVTLPLADEEDAFVPSKTPPKAKAKTLMRSKRADLNEEDAFKKNIKIPSKSKLQVTKELLV